MASPRRYRLLCPIARALDRVGDRWTLLILRDLHAGPARFNELQKGLTGIATNLLSSRLEVLITDGLIERVEAEHGVTLYRLTDLGGQTGDLLFELARFGGQFSPDEDRQRPGNLRTVAITLTQACRRVLKPGAEVRARLLIDEEPFHLIAAAGAVTVLAGPGPEPDVTMTTSYEPMVEVAEGRLDMESFVKNHATLRIAQAEKAGVFLTLMGDAISLLAKG